MWTVQFNLEAALQTNGVIKSNGKEVIKTLPSLKDDGKTQMKQIVGLMRPMFI